MNKARGEKKRKRILLLTVLSQLILSVFVVYWLVGQFNNEKNQLEKDLLHQYLAAEDQLVDSILLKQIIHPALGDSVQLTLNIEKDTVYNPHQQQEPDFQHLSKSNKSDSSKHFIAIGVVSKPDSLKQNKTTYHFNRIIKEDALKRSVKLIINHTDSFQYRRAFPFPLDSALFKKIFVDSLSVKEMSFRMDWYIDTDSSEKQRSGIKINGGVYENIPAVTVSKYAGYIIGRIFPQILFALFLLVLSGTALMFSYRSFRKQMQLNILRADFISNITHELKTPVSTAKVALEALQTFDMKKDADVADKYLKMVSLEMNRLDALTNRVLSHSKLETHGMVLRLEKVNLQELVQSVLSKLEAQLAESKASASFEKKTNQSHILIDPFYIEHVIINLIDNSLKYAAPNPKIIISIEEDSKYTNVMVDDNGPGIPNEYLSKVFENFFRVPKGDTHNVKGHGLGLSFALMVMKQHKGKIEVKNLPERGCRFILKFRK